MALAMIFEDNERFVFLWVCGIRKMLDYIIFFCVNFFFFFRAVTFTPTSLGLKYKTTVKGITSFSHNAFFNHKYRFLFLY